MSIQNIILYSSAFLVLVEKKEIGLVLMWSQGSLKCSFPSSLLFPHKIKVQFFYLKSFVSPEETAQLARKTSRKQSLG